MDSVNPKLIDPNRPVAGGRRFATRFVRHICRIGRAVELSRGEVVARLTIDRVSATKTKAHTGCRSFLSLLLFLIAAAQRIRKFPGRKRIKLAPLSVPRNRFRFSVIVLETGWPLEAIGLDVARCFLAPAGREPGHRDAGRIACLSFSCN